MPRNKKAARRTGGGRKSTEEFSPKPKKAEQSCEANETNYRELVENANSIIMKMDRKGKVTFFNDYAQKFFGYSLGEIIGKDVKILVPPIETSGRNLANMMENILQSPDEFVENINENVLKSGERVWISWRNRAIKNACGNVVGNLAIGQDITKLKRSEDALRESDQRFRSLFENTLDGIMVTVTDGSVLSANPRMCEMLGMTEEEIIKAGRDGIVVQDERLATGLEERARTGKFRGELTFRRKDGSLVPAELSISLFKDPDGTVKSGQVVRDITERKQAEHLLKQAHDELELRVQRRTAEIQRQAELLNLAHDAIIVTDMGGAIVFWNAGAEEIYGYGKEEAFGKVTHALLETEFPMPIDKITENLLCESRWEGELIHRAKDGRQIVVLSRWVLRRNEVGGPEEIMEINRDITKRKRAEEFIQRANAHNRSLIEASLDPLVTIDPGGKITDVNAATEIATGYLRTELIGTDFSDYFTQPEEARSGYQRVFKEGFVRDYALEIRHRDGHATPVLYNATIYKDEPGNIMGVFAAARDISKRRRAEEELLNKTKALEDLNTALRVLIDHYKNDQEEFEERVLVNVRDRIAPYVERLKHTRLDAGQAVILEIIEKGLSEIASRFMKSLSQSYSQFSAREMEIIPLIRDGKTTKEIAQILGLGKRTVDSYRDNIRGKFGLASRKANLRTYLLSIHNTSRTTK